MRLAKILLPVDFSGDAAGAAHYAKALACRFQSELTLVHVFQMQNLIPVDVWVWLCTLNRGLAYCSPPLLLV
jgi:nucleotide-binding universal stress UspA family protein